MRYRRLLKPNKNAKDMRRSQFVLHCVNDLIILVYLAIELEHDAYPHQFVVVPDADNSNRNIQQEVLDYALNHSSFQNEF